MLLDDMLAGNCCIAATLTRSCKNINNRC